MTDTPSSPPKKNRLGRLLRDVVFVLLAIVLIGVWQTRDLAEGIAPDFVALPIDAGSAPSLDQALSAAGDRPLLLHFWASWCGICDMMDGSIDRIADDWPVLSVAYQSGALSAVQLHMQRNDLHFPTVLDAQGAIGQAYGVTAVPTTFIVKPGGEIAYRSVGYSTSWGLRLRLWLATHF